jgi:hypothetical protein
MYQLETNCKNGRQRQILVRRICLGLLLQNGNDGLGRAADNALPSTGLLLFDVLPDMIGHGDGLESGNTGELCLCRPSRIPTGQRPFLSLQIGTSSQRKGMGQSRGLRQIRACFQFGNDTGQQSFLFDGICALQYNAIKQKGIYT